MGNQEMTEQEEWDAEDAESERKRQSLLAIIENAMANKREPVTMAEEILEAIVCNADEFHEYLWVMLM